MRPIFIASITLLARGVTAQSNATLVELNYHYDPSRAAAGIFGTLYAIATILLFYRVFSNRTWWGLCLPTGAAFMTSGFWIRIPMTIYQNSLAIYLTQLLILLLSPAAFLAFNYILYGRFIVNCVERGHSLIRPERTAVYFVISDVSTFGFGGALLSSSNSGTAKTGAYVVLGGLGLQTLSFAFFMFLVYYAFRSLKGGGMKPFEQPWGMILKLLFFSSSLFMLRCIYRTVEFGQGLGQGYLITHEVFFYVFDALPLLIGISAYIVYWPTKYLQRSPVASLAEMNDIYPGYDISTAELIVA
ncbi:RTA1 like protein-domain-containing protein [Phlebopus sp. FC_14]|nr:RTA1 like protein-domain-containing protein [Phlebopus sp. FC_14]